MDYYLSDNDWKVVRRVYSDELTETEMESRHEKTSLPDDRRGFNAVGRWGQTLPSKCGRKSLRCPCAKCVEYRRVWTKNTEEYWIMSYLLFPLVLIAKKKGE